MTLPFVTCRVSRVAYLWQELSGLKRALIVVIQDEYRLYGRYLEHARQAERWERRARLAMERGLEDLVVGALERQVRHRRLAAAYWDEYEVQRGRWERLRRKMEEVGERGRGLSRRTAWNASSAS